MATLESAGSGRIELASGVQYAAVSFVTNTNWQAHSGKAALSNFSQAIGLTVQNFISAATGIAVLWCLIRDLTRIKKHGVGNLYMIWNIAEGDARILIYKLFFTILAVLVAFAVIWVRGIKKQPLFAHAELSEINAAAADVQVA